MWIGHEVSVLALALDPLTEGHGRTSRVAAALALAPSSGPKPSRDHAALKLGCRSHDLTDEASVRIVGVVARHLALDRLDYCRSDGALPPIDIVSPARSPFARR